MLHPTFATIGAKHTYGSKKNGSIEGNLEMKTILNENYEKVTERLYWVTQQYLEDKQGAELVEQP